MVAWRHCCGTLSAHDSLLLRVWWVLARVSSARSTLLACLLAVGQMAALWPMVYVRRLGVYTLSVYLWT